MAVTTVETIIANPARKQGKRKAKARKGSKGSMTAKQIKYFGTARQRAALKAKRRKPKAKAKSNPARKRRAAPRKTVHRKRTAPRRKNPGEIISLVLGNPAKRRKKAVAKTRRRKASARRTSAGRRTTRKNPARMHHRRRTRCNPAGIGMTELVALGGGAMLGGAVPSVLSQAVLKEKNTGFMGYLANLGATFLLAWGAHKVAKGKTGESFAKGILAGGIGSVIKRAITDYSLLGTYGQTLGLGDYMVANFTNPPRVADGLNSPMYEIPGGWAPTTIVQAPNPAGMGCYGSGPLYG